MCGEVIDDTVLNSADSTLEAMCVSPKGSQKLQLVRQLTAAALNCVMSGDVSGCSDANSTISIASVFRDCSAGCATGTFANDLSVGECISLIDDFNNGVGTGCHDRVLVNEDLGLDFDPPGPAGSAKACRAARGNSCKVVGSGEASCSTGNTSPDPESCPD